MFKKVIYLTNTRPEYSLNAVCIKGLKENGIEVMEYYSKKKNFFSLFQVISFYWKNSKNADFVIAGYNSPSIAIFLNLFSRKKIIFNAVLSEYERMVISRNLVHPFSPKAFYYWFLDFMAVHLADLTILESEHQVEFFNRLFKVSKRKLYKNWIGVDENKFFYNPSIEKFDIFTIAFRGALMPEAGVEYAIQAAKVLENKNCNFVILGGGIFSEKMKRIINDLRPTNLEYISEFLSDEKLRNIMQKCHISLGQLSSHTRLVRTLPHKAYESLVMKLPYLTASNSGILELLNPGETCLACKPASVDSLAEKILWAKNNYPLVKEMAERGYQLYQERLSSKVLIRNLLNKIESLSGLP